MVLYCRVVLVCKKGRVGVLGASLSYDIKYHNQVLPLSLKGLLAQGNKRLDFDLVVSCQFLELTVAAVRAIFTIQLSEAHNGFRARNSPLVLEM